MYKFQFDSSLVQKARKYVRVQFLKEDHVFWILDEPNEVRATTQAMLISQEVKIILLLTFLTGSFCFGGSFSHDQSRYTNLNVVFVLEY